MKDPGTVYSDDEIDCYSDDDLDENTKQQIGTEDGDNFFEDMADEIIGFKFTRPVEKSLPFIKKYLKNSSPHDVNNTIQRVLLEEGKKKELEEDSDEDQDPVQDNVKPLQGTDRIKVKERSIKIKENKRERIEERNELQREKETLNFEFAPAPNADASFLEMNLSSEIMKAIEFMGYNEPTPVQASAIPIALKGRDICGCAATGTGKTAAFMLPIIQRLIYRPSNDAVTRVLVLVPTRELGIQVFEVSRDLAQFTTINISLTVGGLNKHSQSEELLENPDIIIATPGRLIDHIHNTPTFSLKEIEILVLDEADRMLDKYFVEQLTEVINQCCITRQTMLFSATMTDQVKDLVNVSLKNPVKVFVNNNTDVAQNLKQEFIRLKIHDNHYRLCVLTYLLVHHFKKESLVFVQEKRDCHRLHIIFGLFGLKCGELHGNLKQKQRLIYLQKFKDGEIDVLFATDVAARGLDIKGVKTVINYSVPRTYELYVHRVGRTARAGFTGRSITISWDSGPDFAILRKIQKESLTPLYERIISAKKTEEFDKKLKDLEPSVNKVLELEKAEKLLHGTEKAIDKAQTSLTRLDRKPEQDIPVEPKKKLSVGWKAQFETLEDIRKEKARLKLVLEGKIPLKDPDKPTFVKKTPIIKRTKQKKQHPKKNKVQPEEEGSKRKSNFERDLTQTDAATVKRLRKGPSYEERKSDFEQKNPNKKFKFSKNKR